MSLEKINPLAIKQGAKKKAMFAGGGSSSGFDATMEMLGAAGGVAATSMQLYGPKSPTAPTVLAAAFSGVNSYNSMSGGSVPSYAFGGAQTVSGGVMPINPGSPVVPGTDNFSQMDMINTMNQNNLQLLELQAVMQTNMQGWNTKANILSADHRARMAMIEKFTAR